jgi:multiple sugar transport system permease protein
MLDRKRPFWKSSILHLVLLGGAVVFGLPYAWLVGTSWKLDKEVQTAQIRILPKRPVPTAVSPYIDTREFSEIERPGYVPADAWNKWMNWSVRSAIDEAIRGWHDERAAPLLNRQNQNTLACGVFQRLVSVLPHGTWQLADKSTFQAAVAKALSDDMVRDSFAQAYRYFAIGTVRLVTQDYRIADLTGVRRASDTWWVVSGPARLEARTEAGRSVAVVNYDYDTTLAVRKGDVFEIAGNFEAPMDLADREDGFKRIELSFHSDQSWHDMRVLVEMNGKLYRSASPKYLADDFWWETAFQLPGPDDRRLMPRRYILLKEIDSGRQYDHGPRAMKVRIQVERSGQLEALWAKATENYRKAFDEVPFWRYFKTSVFLVVVNIIGTAFSCSLAAYAFARLNWPGRNLCFVLVLATLMIPPQVTMIPSFVIYKYLGWYNTLAPLWVPNCLAVNGFAIFLLRQAMRGIPKDLEEAAKIDGAGHLRIYWHIVMPLVKPTLAAISIFTFMFVWNDFMSPLIYVNDQRLYPLALGLFSFMAGRENQFTLIMAGSMIMTLPVIITFFLAQRYFIQGVAMSGMKN